MCSWTDRRKDAASRYGGATLEERDGKIILPEPRADGADLENRMDDRRRRRGGPAGAPSRARLRLAEIARAAEVSEATVSRVLNGKPGVASETRQAVFAALDMLGVERPRKLQKPRNGLVGLLVPELTNPVFPVFVQVIESALSMEGYTPVLCTMSPGGVPESEYVDMLLARGVDGIIFVSAIHADMSAEHARYEALVSSRIPVVLVNGRLDALAVTSISADEEAAMRVAITHLVTLGHRAIGFATGPLRYRPSAEKREAFLRAMKDLAEVDATRWVEVSSFFTVEGGRAAADRLLGAGVTAIVCANDLMALGAVRAAEALGLKVPAHLSVVGYDDTPLMSFTSPPLTTVRQPVRAMGEAAVRALLDEMRGVPVAHVDLRFHPELVVRGSTGPVRADAG